MGEAARCRLPVGRVTFLLAVAASAAFVSLRLNAAGHQWTSSLPALAAEPVEQQEVGQPALPVEPEGDPCESRVGPLAGLDRVLVVVMKDSYNHVEWRVVSRQVTSIERTWGRWVPHLTYALLNQTSEDPPVRLPVGEWLRSPSLPKSNHSIILHGSLQEKGHWKSVKLEWKTFAEETRRWPGVDWVVHLTLQSFLVAPNLCSFLSRLKDLSARPTLVGRPLLIKGEEYPSAFGTCGAILSRVGLLQFANFTQEFDRLPGRPLSANLANAGLFVRDSRDESGLERLHVFSVVGELYPKPEPWAQTPCCWFDDYSFYGHQQGLECCAATTISFHYIDPPEQLALHYALERAAELRRARGAAADLAEEVFGPAWGAPADVDEYGKNWRDPAHGGARFNNSLARELLANRIRLGSAGARWDVSRTLQEPAWTRAGWRSTFQGNASGGR